MSIATINASWIKGLNYLLYFGELDVWLISSFDTNLSLLSTAVKCIETCHFPGRAVRMDSGRTQFPFPYQPYDIQEQFMQALYSALDQGRVGIFESPTGTVCGMFFML